MPGFHDPAVLQKIAYRPLGKTGLHVSPLSFGTSALGSSFFGEARQEQSDAVVDYVLKSGINLLDTAPWYGFSNTEKTLGKALSRLPRNAYYLSTKVGRYKPEPLEMFDFRHDRTLQSVDTSLERLGVSYLDIVQVHDVEFAPSLDVVVEETLPALAKAKREGKTRFIGITGYSLSALKYIVEKSPVPIDTVLSYGRLAINNTTLQEYVPFFQSKGLGILNGSPLGLGLLSPSGPPVWHPATAEIKEACKKAVDYCASKHVDITRLGVVFSMKDPAISSTLFGTNDLNQVKANVQCLHNPTLSAEEQACLDHVLHAFFAPLAGQESWEGLEPTKYWIKVGKALLTERLYPKQAARK